MRTTSRSPPVNAPETQNTARGQGLRFGLSADSERLLRFEQEARVPAVLNPTPTARGYTGGVPTQRRLMSALALSCGVVFLGDQYFAYSDFEGTESRTHVLRLAD